MIEQTSVYRICYKAAINAGKDRSKACLRELIKLRELGVDSPTQTKLIMNRAKKDYIHDVWNLPSSYAQKAFQTYSVYKTALFLKFNKQYRDTMKIINDASKKLYPRTHKIRQMLIKSGKVSMDNPTGTIDRLAQMNISPKSIAIELS